jgi:hypothetical protein
MLMPDEYGLFTCDDCPYKTPDLFELLEHCETEFFWSIKLSRRYSFDLFQFLQAINELINDGEVERLKGLSQAVALAFVNSSEGNNVFNKFINENIVRSNIDSVIQNLEEMLKDENESR